MNNFVLNILLIIFFKQSHSKWIREWSDEFDNKTIDIKKWEIENELDSCNGNYINQLNCNTNNSRNLQLIDGTLAIAAIYEKHLDKEYTSAKITTKQGFTYGRFEIRAALPKGKMLRSAMSMIPVINSEWARNGQIDIMTETQSSGLGSGIHYNVPPKYENKFRGNYETNKNLNDFHIYTLEWNEFEIKWFFDDINYMTINISRKLGSDYTENGQPFNMPFRLLINLGIGGSAGGIPFFPNNVLTIDDVIRWKCSLLIIDYVRIYKWVNGTEKLNSSHYNVSRDKVCSSIMPLISPQKKGNIGFTTIISVFSSLLLILLITIVVFFLVRKKKLRRMNIENNYENYADIYDTDGYEVINVSKEYPYEDIGLKLNHQKENITSKPVYLEINDQEIIAAQ